MTAPFIFVVAGEPSGDALGARLIAALRQRTGGRLRVAGIGGEAMREEGVESLVPLADLAVVGVAEVLPKAPLILRHVRGTVAAIRRLKPDAVVTIDSSGFSWRIAHRLRRHGELLPLIHYVAPMVWAWRAGRARRMARWYDHLMTLLPFEPPYFERVGLSCSYVGHPILETGAGRGDAAGFRQRHGLGPNDLLLVILPGSRAGEVRRLLPVFGEALRLLVQRLGPFRVAVPTVSTVAAAIAAAVPDWPGRPLVVTGEDDKYSAFAAGRVALAASGSVALELALACLPAIVAYRVNPATETLLRRVLRVRYVNLVNLILDRPLVPELLGRDCTPQRLAAALAGLVEDKAVRTMQQQGYDEAIARLRAGVECPSLAAADRVLDIIARHPKRS